MFKRLQQKWKVGPFQITLIIICFALGGSATGYTAKKIITLLSINSDWLWAIVYILLVTIIWPIAVLIVSVFLGQYAFFSGYVKRLGAKLGLFKDQNKNGTGDHPAANAHAPTNIAIFASGKGSNAQKIIDHFKTSSLARISLIVSNKKNAGVLEIAEQENIPFIIIEREPFFSGDAYLPELRARKIDLIVLAGFLWKIPDQLVHAYQKKIINIHPALLPKYGGKGMYGNNVHEAVLSAKDRESGITIHFVDEHYDNGDIILQVKCPVLEGDTPDMLANRIHVLEHANYPVIVEELVKNLQATNGES